MERYYSLSRYLKEKYGHKVLKLSIDGGFTCPNRINGKNGCIFCSDEGSGEFAACRSLSIGEQIDSQIEFIKHKSKSDKYIAYFQSFTNTFAPVEELRSKYYEAINHPNIIALSIATRPDCIDEEVVDLLEEISQKTELWVELGFQTSNEDTARLINRGYKNEVFQDAVNLLHKRGIMTIAHIIFGLPFENKTDFMNTVNYVTSLPIWGIKFHSLYIYKGGPLYNYYLNTRFRLLSLEEYVDAVCSAIEILPKHIVIHRITGDPDKTKLFLPKWPMDKIRVIGSINKELKKRNIVSK